LTFGKKFPKNKNKKNKNDTRLYKNGMPAGGELSVFKKPSKILHSIKVSTSLIFCSASPIHSFFFPPSLTLTLTSAYDTTKVQTIEEL
jgi:hypothetical protein